MTNAGLLATLRLAWDEWWSPHFSGPRNAPLWAHLLATFLFSSAIGLSITAFVWVFSGGRIDVERTVWANFVIAQCIGFSINGLFVLGVKVFGEERIDLWRGWRRAAFFFLVPLWGVAIGYALSFTLLGLIHGRPGFGWVSGWFVAGGLMVVAVVTLVWWRFYHHQLRAAEALRQVEAERARAERAQRQVLDAQLRSLQAQIEPHFLFNTLANVVSLIESAPADARRMLERLIALLRQSLAASRTERVTLAQEAELLRAYLEILAIRMGARLRYELDVPETLRDRTVPPLLLQPLVENAVRHGLEPKVEGGRVRVTARAVDGVLRLDVEDDGLGFGDITRGGGAGLTNLRDRLAAMYGERARLAIEDGHPGTRVRIELPLDA